MAAMDDVPREILQAAYKRNPIYLYKVPLHFGIWVGSGFFLAWLNGAALHVALKILIGFACSVLIANVIRGLGAYAHDSVHGTVFKSKTASYWFGLLCWAPTGMSYTIYQNYHLHHHRITNTYPDVDNFVVTDYTKNPTLARMLLLAVYTFAYPLYFLFQMFRYTNRLSTWQKVRMNVEVLGFWSLVALAGFMLPLYVMVFAFIIPFILGAMLASMTSMIEHFEMEPGEDAYSSRTYATDHYFLNYLWNNVSFHNEHHKFPGIPWYNLRSFHEAAYPYYDEKVKQDCCHKDFITLLFKLWGRVLSVDVAKIEAKYAHLNHDEEKKKHMELAGISPVNV
jgi:fatty acid desaturase